LVAAGELSCQYCGLREGLPKEHADLVVELNRRLTLAANAAFQATGVLKALARIFEQGSAVGSVAGLFFVLALGVTVVVLLGAVPLWQVAPQELLASLVVSSLATPALLFAVPVSIMVARQVGRFRYRVTVRPYLLARPPLVNGGRARCRVCGGELPASNQPILSCPYCRTESVVGQELFAASAVALEREQVQQLERSRALAPAAQRLSRWMGAAMGLGFCVTLASAAVLLWLIYSIVNSGTH
jgi:uncharacterized membrane protein